MVWLLANRPKYYRGEVVQAHHPVTRRIEKGFIRVVQRNAKYTINFDKGGVSTNNSGSNISPYGVYKKSQKIQCRSGWWFKSQVMRINPDGTYLIEMEDGYRTNVIFSQIRPKTFVRYDLLQKIQINGFFSFLFLSVGEESALLFPLLKRKKHPQILMEHGMVVSFLM